MTPFQFGALVKLAGQPGISPAPASFWQQWSRPPKGSGYLNTLDRWYNPRTKQQVTERGEKGLMRAGQASMLTGAAAGGGAAFATGVPGAVLGPSAMLGAGGGLAHRSYRNIVGLPNTIRSMTGAQ